MVGLYICIYDIYTYICIRLPLFCCPVPGESPWVQSLFDAASQAQAQAQAQADQRTGRKRALEDEAVSAMEEAEEYEGMLLLSFVQLFVICIIQISCSFCMRRVTIVKDSEGRGELHRIQFNIRYNNYRCASRCIGASPAAWGYCQVIRHRSE